MVIVGSDQLQGARAVDGPTGMMIASGAGKLKAKTGYRVFMTIGSTKERFS
jgi:hypothetical protein